MMHQNELRPGNYVYYVDKGQKGEMFSKVDWEDFKWLNMKPNSFNECHEPIPLTPEILKKCGFIFKGGEYYTINDVISFSYDSELGLYATWIIRDNPINHVKYLHQLQNLYFALTGTEINFTP